jgi:hypothetical protein
MISVSPSSCDPVSGRHGSRTHMALKPHGLANRPGEPYPATFRLSVDRPGNRTPISWLQARHLPVGRAAHLSEVRPGIEPGLPPYQGGVRPQHLQTTSDPGWNRTITFLDVSQASLPLDHGIRLSVTEVGVEPTKSRGSRPRRFARLRTRPISSGSGSRTRRAERMKLGWALAHPR